MLSNITHPATPTVIAEKIETSDFVSDEGDSIAREDPNHHNDESENDMMTAPIKASQTKLTKHLKD